MTTSSKSEKTAKTARSWMPSIGLDKAPITIVAPTQAKKSKAQPTIVHKIFYECGRLLDDEYWKNVFTKASYGKFPKGFTFKDNKLTYRYKSKVHVQEIPLETSSALKTIVLFMKKTGQIMSECDKRRDQEDLELHNECAVNVLDTTWDKLSKSIRTLMILWVP